MEENTIEQNTKTQIGARIDPQIFAAIEHLATTDERTISNTVERLLRSHPVIEQLMAAETNGASA